MQCELPNIATLHANSLHAPGKTNLKTINFNHVLFIAEDYVKSGNKVETVTWIYLPGTRFTVKETREQILELLGWDRYNKQVKETT
jgi:hypothetical protein